MSKPTQLDKDLFNEIIELPTEDRQAYLDGACRGNEAQHHRLQELIDAYSDESPVLRTRSQDTMLDSPLKEGPGTTIGRYKLLQKIGEGGMGIVFMSEQTEPVRRKVALKIIKLGMDTKSVVARFEAERQALALMDHPNIAKVLDAGSTDTGRPYFVMELVKGVPINTYCDKNQLLTRERLELFTQVCQSIQHAHQKGVIHRDIKPSNILVTLHDGKPVPKVIDFGIAKATNQRLTEKTLFTNFAQMIGTPAYMSPEQAEMSGLDVDTRTDVYSLGVLLYELLTGTTPFPEKQLLSKGYGEMQRIIAEQEPERPSLRMSTLVGEQQSIVTKNRAGELPLLTKQLRGDLDWIVMKSLEKDRTRRYETANALGEDIRRHLNSEPVFAAKPSVGYQLAKLYQRHKPAFAAAAGIAVALITGTIAATANAIEAKIASEEADRAKIKAELLLKDKEELAEDLLLKAEEADGNERKARRLLYAADLRDAARAMDEENYGQAKRLLARQADQKEFQGWEWRHLWMRTQETPHQTIKDDGPLSTHSLSVSPDQRYVAVGIVSQNGRETGLEVWDRNTGDQAKNAPKTKFGRTRTAFSPRENLLAYGSQETGEGDQSRVHFWNADSQQEVASFEIQGTCEGLAFTQDGATLYAAVKYDSQESEVFRWDVDANQIVSTIPAPDLHARLGLWQSFDIDHTGRFAAYLTQDAHAVEILDLETGKSISRLDPASEGPVLGVALSPDGRIAITGTGKGSTGDGTATTLWDTRTGEALSSLMGSSKTTLSTTFWPDGNRVAVGSTDQTVRIWDVSEPRNPQILGTLRGHQTRVTQIKIAPDETTLYSGGTGEVFAWNIESQPALGSEFSIDDIFRERWAFTHEGKSLIALQGNQVVQHNGPEFQDSETLFELEPSENVFSAGFSEHATYMATGSEDGFVTLWDLESHEPYRYRVSDGPVTISLVKRNGDVVLEARTSNSPAREYQIVNAKASRKLHSFPLYSSMLPFSAESPNGEVFARINHGSEVGALVKNISTGKEIPITTATIFTRAVFSPNGKNLALVSWAQRVNGAVHVFDTDTFQQNTTFNTHVPISGWRLLAFSPDSRRMVTNGAEWNGLRLWDTETGQPVMTLGREYDDLLYAQFSPDGKWLGCSSKKTLRLWRAPTWEEIARSR